MGSDGTPYELVFKVNQDYIVPNEILTKAPFIGYEDGSYSPGLSIAKDIQRKGMSLPFGTSIITTDTENAILEVQLNTLASSVSNIKTGSPTSIVRSKFNFGTIEDKEGNQKLAVIIPQ
jgi:hypothetical protein